jgi:hypothetical protein
MDLPAFWEILPANRQIAGRKDKNTPGGPFGAIALAALVIASTDLLTTHVSKWLICWGRSRYNPLGYATLSML